MKEIMFWLFKDPVNSGLDQFDHAQSVKNGLKVKKIKLPQMNFFLEKQLINSGLAQFDHAQSNSKKCPKG